MMDVPGTGSLRRIKDNIQEFGREERRRGGEERIRVVLIARGGKSARLEQIQTSISKVWVVEGTMKRIPIEAGGGNNHKTELI